MSCKYNNIFLYIKERAPNISKDLRNVLLVFMLVVEVAEVDFVADVASSH